MNEKIYSDNKLTIADKLTIALFIFIAGFLFIQQNKKTDDDEIMANIFINDVEQKSFSLNKDNEISFPVTKAPFKIMIKDKSLKVIESGCPNKICMHRGFIKFPGETIVCVPNKVIITLKGKGKKQAVVDCIAQ